MRTKILLFICIKRASSQKMAYHFIFVQRSSILFLYNDPLHLSFQIYWHKVTQSIFCFVFLIHLFVYSFFFIQLARDCSILLFFTKETATTKKNFHLATLLSVFKYLLLSLFFFFFFFCHCSSFSFLSSKFNSLLLFSIVCLNAFKVKFY